MNTIIKLTRRQVIKAVRNEPVLMPEQWVSRQFEEGIYGRSIAETRNACPVCAVGAVMRSALDPNQKVKMIHNAAVASVSNSEGRALCVHPGDEIRPFRKARLLAKAAKQAKDGHHMAALSLVFETLWSDARSRRKGCNKWAHPMTWRKSDFNRVSKRIRAQVIEFVKKHFPATIEVNIDGARPAKDIIVLRTVDVTA